jgi:dipeptidyl aminopeptidase/acylaminoacyl peptidase
MPAARRAPDHGFPSPDKEATQLPSPGSRATVPGNSCWGAEMKSILVAAMAFLSVATAASAAPLAAYGLLPQIEQVEISPDGSRLAIMKTRGEDRTVEVHEAETMKFIVSASVGSEKLRSITWADNDNLLFTISQTTEIDVATLESSKVEYATGYLLNVVTKRQRLLGNENVDTILISSPEVRTVDGKTTIYFAAQVRTFDKRLRPPSLMRTRAEGKTAEIIGPADTVGAWIIGSDGKILASMPYRTRIGYYIANAGSKKLDIRAPKGFELGNISGLGPDGSTIIATYYPERARPTDPLDAPITAQVSMETGEWSAEPMSEYITDMMFDPLTQRLVGYVELKGDERTTTYLHPDDIRAWNAVKKAFSDSEVSVASWSANRRKVVVRVDSPTLGPAYALVNLQTGQAAWIGDVYPIIDEDISPVKPISYTAADGLKITGYLTTPYGAEARNLPLIVLAHGGPAARDVPGFDWWAQALASRGYAVLQANFRGSDGFGHGFMEAGYGEWGKKMQTDLSDGVRHLASQGVIDPKRVCIAGASYGGYAALAGATIDRGVYRCAASISGPADLKRILGTELMNDGRAALRYWSRFMGVKGINDPALGLISPVALVDQIEIPVLLMHGKDDSVVPYEHTTRMADAMGKAGKSVEVVTLEGEDHWLSKGGTRLKMLQSLVAFLEKHNPPNKPMQTAGLQ